MFHGVLFCVLILSLSAAAFADTKVLARWSQMKSYKDNFGGELDVRATYYSAEYIEALVKQEAEKNLWTSNETDQYKYQLLSGLSLDEYIPIHIEFDNRGPTMHLAPFDSFLTLWVGKNKLTPVDFDKRFNFSFQGKRDGLVFFPRYDNKGKSYLEGVKTIRFAMTGAISSVTINLSTLDFVWDVVRDNPEALYTGRAAARLELDRLIKRIEKLNAEKRELEGKLSEVNAELDTITNRVEELQRQ
ncbi:MAG: hypothetical protein EOM51_11130 [Clostridia bacterium]|nr:hypothetical protein [Clostridia bacterium]